MTREDQRQYGATPGERRAYELYELRRAVRRMLRAEDGIKHGRIWMQPNTARQIRLEQLACGWGTAYEKHRKQVEDLIA